MYLHLQFSSLKIHGRTFCTRFTRQWRCRKPLVPPLNGKLKQQEIPCLYKGRTTKSQHLLLQFLHHQAPCNLRHSREPLNFLRSPDPFHNSTKGNPLSDLHFCLQALDAKRFPAPKSYKLVSFHKELTSY